MPDSKIGMPTTPLKTETKGVPPSAQTKQEAEVKTVLPVVPEKPISETKPTPQAQKTPQVDAKTSKTVHSVQSEVKNGGIESAEKNPGSSGRSDTPQDTSSNLPQAEPSGRNTLQPLPRLELIVHPVSTALDKMRACLSPTIKLLLAAVLLPSLLSLLYFGLLASPMYIAEARFAVRGADSSSTTGGLAAMFLPSGASVGADAHIVAEYIQSPDIMEAIDGEMGIFEHFSSHDHDPLSRLAAGATRDERLTYWKWAVKPSFDPETGIIALSVKAYDPVMAKRLAEAVLAKSEALVNAMSRRAKDDAITLAMAEVSTAEQRVSKAQEAMRAFRDRSGMLDPASTAGGLQGIVSQLESEAVKVRAEIAQAHTFMSKNAPALVGLRARLEAVEKQLAQEKLRLAGEARPGSLTSFAGEYEGLQTENEFARQQLVSAMTSLEAARVKAEAKSRYVVAFQIPALPDESLYPLPFLFTAYVFVGALVLVGLCSLIIAAVREHAGF